MGLGKSTSLENKSKLSLKLLVVDDDELNRRMMKVLLGREGHDVDLAANGAEAVEAVQNQHYHVVFMDLQMPIMDGVEASRRIRQWEEGRSHTFIVALTASYLPEEGHILFEAGIDNYISKPFELEHIQRMLMYISDSHSTPALVEKKDDTSESKLNDGILNIRLGIQRVGGDEEMYRELLGDFVKELPDRLGNMQILLQERNMSMLGRAAHNIKGVAMNLGATGLAERAGELDKQCNDGYTDFTESLLLELRAMGSRLQETAREFLTGATAAEGV